MELVNRSLTVEQFLAETADMLGLRRVGTCTGAEREITVPEVSRPGFVLTGFTEKYQHRRIQVLGYTEPAFSYALYSDGDLSEFVRGADQDIFGKVHANGDLFLSPSGTTLSIDSPAMTATGNMIRTTDASVSTATPAFKYHRSRHVSQPVHKSGSIAEQFWDER